MKNGKLTIIFVTCFVLLLSAKADYDVSSIINEQDSSLKPSNSLSAITKAVARRLSISHYRKLDIDNALSVRLLDKYINTLDPSHSLFTQQDIKKYKLHQHELDDDLKSGNLDLSYNIYNQFKARQIEKTNYLLSELNSLDNLNFKSNESLELDSEKQQWQPNKTALKSLWKKHLKYNVLNLKIDNKDLAEIKDVLEKRYTRQLKQLEQVTSDDVFNLYINSLAKIFDPHSQYMSPEILENFKIQMSLSLQGIGAMLQTDGDHTKIVSLVPGGPAEKSKLLAPNDKIVGVGQDTSGEMIDVVGWRIDEVVKLIRGKKGSTVRLQVIPAKAPDKKTKIVSLIRDEIKLEDKAARESIIDVEHQEKNYQYGVITIPSFYSDFNGQLTNHSSHRSVTRDVTKIVKSLNKKKVNGIIIDLRNNGGGSLEEAINLSGLFIHKGPTVQIKDTYGRISIHRDPDPKILYSGPLILLVNRYSASASEIFAGAMQDYHRAIIIGEQTFGKGTVQGLVDIKKGKLKLTEAKFYRVSGGSTQNKGIIPDISFPSLKDIEDAGESALPDALPWDTITPAPYNQYTDVDYSLINKLTLLHHERVKKNADFIYFKEFFEHQEKLAEDTLVWLNEDQLLKEQKENKATLLSMENKKRRAKGKKALKSLDELNNDEASKDTEVSSKVLEEDAYIMESAHILSDYINQLSHKQTKSILQVDATTTQ